MENDGGDGDGNDADRGERYDRTEVLVLSRREREGEGEGLDSCLVGFTSTAPTTAAPGDMQDSVGVAVACCFVTASRQQPISSPPASWRPALSCADHLLAHPKHGRPRINRLSPLQRRAVSYAESLPWPLLPLHSHTANI